MRQRRVWGWVLALAPLAAGTVVLWIMAMSGNRSILVIETGLSTAFFSIGAALTVIALGILASHARSSRRKRQQIEVARVAADEAAIRERDKHHRFLARLDHELKNPLTAIRATAASSREAETAESASWVTVDAQATKLSGVVRDLRKLAELESLPLELEDVDMEQLLVESIDALRQQDAAAGGRVTLTVTRVPWPIPRLQLDADLIAVLLDNVISNAAKYSETGPIEVRLREQEGWAVVEVADAGRGIPADEVSGVFDELARARNARDVAGSGIGLSLVATVARRHGGDVSIRSAEGSGSVVTLRLPVVT